MTLHFLCPLLSRGQSWLGTRCPSRTGRVAHTVKFEIFIFPQLSKTIFLQKNWKTSAVSTTDGWLKLNFASCVVRKTRSLGALVLCSICSMVFVNYIYVWLLILSSTNFMVGRSRVFYMYSSWKIQVGDSPGCHQGQQDDFTRTMLSITILRTDTI